MNNLITVASLLYVISSVGYILYLFFQKEYLHRLGQIFLATGFLCNSVMIGYYFAEAGQIPVRNLHETLLVSGWAVAGVFFAFQYRFQVKVLGGYAAFLAAVCIVASLLVTGKTVEKQTIFNSIWLIAHVISIFTGHAAFALACGVGLLYIAQENAIKGKKHGFFYKRLPSLDLLDSTGYASIAAGFTLLTIGLITGFIYAKSAWGRFWSWDPKEVWSGITWLLYAAILHGRLTVGWRGKKAAVMAIIGFAVVLFTFFGVNFLLKGHHGVFTK
jgi:cytochrome c-type biogenesis protein CcsB